jgi:hypothetical protein
VSGLSCLGPFPRIALIRMEAKNLVIEALTLVGRDDLRLAVASAQAAENVRFTFRLDEGMHIQTSIHCKN